ncbi:glutamate-cysteine ligase family 2 [Richelia sinica FACHB-800]|uniref:Glutamate-cysteine ligase family 2 n=1 Tax=Richelia sinica FACHB-800 TaxID=1357546 RepID=A0A975Y5A5_9NOST|nr:glutamate-cysteine ligase family 2 [Richelia sinica FACHB-800]QXE24014.1 glutamate-cysteine ligase family 2 [Richelia sinica FACHB-800]
MSDMGVVKRRIGLEQEFFLVDENGYLSDRADEFLDSCHLMAQAQGINPNYFVPEFVKSMVEINTPPAYTGIELAREYLKNLKLALSVSRQMHLRLYPLSSYPLHIMPVMRDRPNYHIQARTVGYDKFLHAGKCTGTHLCREQATTEYTSYTKHVEGVHQDVVFCLEHDHEVEGTGDTQRHTVGERTLTDGVDQEYCGSCCNRCRES